MLTHPPSILITDDDRDFRETLWGVFANRGFRPILAADGEEALTIVQVEPVHLLLVDMHMPKLTGLETLRRARQMLTDLPCILVSAALDDEIRRQAQLAEAFEVMSKPFGVREITDVVGRAMREAYGWPPAN